MIEAVLLFGFLSGVFELCVLGMVPPRTRLRVLGDPSLQKVMHIAFLIVNLWIHWGTFTGSMTAITAFLASVPAILIAKLLWGSIRETENGDEVYKRGILAYRIDELVS